MKIIFPNEEQRKKYAKGRHPHKKELEYALKFLYHDIRGSCMAVSRDFEDMLNDFRRGGDIADFEERLEMAYEESRNNSLVVNAVHELGQKTLCRDISYNLDELINFTVGYESHWQKVTKISLPKGDSNYVSSENLIYLQLRNMLSNAYASTRPENREIKVSLSRLEGDYTYCLSVQDNGCGISAKKAEEMVKVFEPGYSTKKTPSGIGLSVTRRILYLLGAYMEVESEVDKGSTFSLYLPD